MIVRDNYGIVIQQPVDINSCDDSLARTSLLVLGGSEFDKKILEFWYPMGGEPARHPFEPHANQYSGENGLSRDQLICYVAALHKLGTPEARAVAEKIRQRHGMFINKDVLMPDLKYVFAKAANHWSQYLWAIPGIPMNLLSIVWSSIIDPYIMVKIRILLKKYNINKDANPNEHELNQILCQASVVGNWAVKLLCKLHPNWKRNLEDYWGVHPTSHGIWRQMPEVAMMLIAEFKKIL